MPLPSPRPISRPVGAQNFVTTYKRPHEYVDTPIRRQADTFHPIADTPIRRQADTFPAPADTFPPR